MTDPPPAARCERVLLLLSLHADAAATPDQQAEIEAHLPACDGCRRAAAADRAVGERLRARAAGAVPDGFADRVAAAVAADRAAVRRFLVRAAAAAALVTAVATGTALLGGGSSNEGRGAAMADVRSAAREAVFRPRT